MAINYFADTSQTLSIYEIHAEVAAWTSEPPHPVYTLVPVNVYYGMLTISAWLAYPHNLKKRKDSMHARFADGAYAQWRDNRIRREGIPDDALPTSISIAKRKRLIEATHRKTNERIREAVEIVWPFIKARDKRSFYEIAEARANEDNGNFYRRLKKLLPVAHLALAYGRFGLPEYDDEVLNTLNYAEALRRKICRIQSNVIDSAEIVQFRPQAVMPGAEVNFG